MDIRSENSQIPKLKFGTQSKQLGLMSFALYCLRCPNAIFNFLKSTFEILPHVVNGICSDSDVLELANSPFPTSVLQHGVIILYQVERYLGICKIEDHPLRGHRATWKAFVREYLMPTINPRWED
ncbi:hypothetical protein SUGI_1034810 [Cryptomeria japonica]|nr:hypothetical protein SUGI_1034810 [Cryptomeria japonica]